MEKREVPWWLITVVSWLIVGLVGSMVVERKKDGSWTLDLPRPGDFPRSPMPVDASTESAEVVRIESLDASAARELLEVLNREGSEHGLRALELQVKLEAALQRQRAREAAGSTGTN